MISELRFYEIDETLLGTSTEDEEGEEEGEEGEEGQIEEQKRKLFSAGIDEEEDKVKTAMERFASEVDEDSRDREAQKIIETEMDITDF